MPRNERLDVWRGLCLVDVVLVHLAFGGLGFPEPLDTTIRHYFRFAAGGFVFLAGLTVAVVFGPKVHGTAAERRRVYRRLWRRAAMLAALELGAAVAYRLVDPLRRWPTSPEPFAPSEILDFVLLVRPGVTGGILLLYAAILAAMPLALAVWRRFGAVPIAVSSAAIYGVAVVTDGLRWPPGEFPVPWWQPIFVAGFLSVGAYQWICERRTRGLAWAAGATAAFAVVFLAHAGPALGVTAVAERVPLSFDKNPLRPGGLLWYLTITQVVLAWTHVLWDRVLTGRRATGALALLGRHSLLVYVAHVFTEVPILELTWEWWPPALVRTGLAGADLLALFALCATVESRRLAPAALAWPRLLRAGSLAAVATSLAFATDLAVRPAVVLTDLEEEPREVVEDIFDAEPTGPAGFQPEEPLSPDVAALVG